LAARLDDHQGTVRSLGFIPASGVLISGGDDRTLRLWDLAAMDASGETILQRAQHDFGVRLLGSEIHVE
jgi:WD40 repeat protein